MRPAFRVLASLAALSSAAFVASASLAEPSAEGAAPPAGMAEHWAEHKREHVEAKAKALRDILNLRPDQEPAFQAFLASMKPLEDREEKHEARDEAATAALTTPERLDRMAARMAEHQAAFQRHIDAVKRFYAVLSPEQQRAFDAAAGMMMGMRHHEKDGPEDRFERPHGED